MIDEIITTKNKRISIVITENAKVILKIPTNISREVAQEFVNKKASWIAKNKQKQLDKITKFNNIINKKTLFLYGEEYKISYLENTKAVVREDKNIYFPIKCKSNIDKYIKTYLSNLSKKIIFERVKQIEKIIGISSSKLSLTSAKRKWGSCSSKKEIKLNFRLIMLTPTLIDYVIIHELCHIRELNHSKKFWALVSMYDKNYKSHRIALKGSSVIGSLY